MNSSQSPVVPWKASQGAEAGVRYGNNSWCTCFQPDDLNIFKNISKRCNVRCEESRSHVSSSSEDLLLEPTQKNLINKWLAYNWHWIRMNGIQEELNFECLWTCYDSRLSCLLTPLLGSACISMYIHLTLNGTIASPSQLGGWIQVRTKAAFI